MSTIEEELRDLKAIFGNKKILSPSDVAPILGRSVGTLANMRVAGACPLPVFKIGRSVGFNIRHIAEYLSTGQIENKAVESKQNKSILPATRRISKAASITKNRSWLLAMQNSITLNYELFQRLERHLLEYEVSNVAKRSDKKPLKDIL